MVKTLVLALVLALLPISGFAGYHHAALPVAKTVGQSGHSGLGAGLVGSFIIGVAIAIIVHEVLGPTCASKGAKNGYDQPTFWRPLCKKQPVVAAFSK